MPEIQGIEFSLFWDKDREELKTSRKDPIRSFMTSHKLESVEPHFQPDEKPMSQNLRELAA